LPLNILRLLSAQRSVIGLYDEYCRTNNKTGKNNYATFITLIAFVGSGSRWYFRRQNGTSWAYA